MFTGIIKEMGRVSSLVKIGNIYRLSIASKSIYGTVKIGDSISINGVCLTVVKREGNELASDIMEETIRRTSLASLRKGDLVNIEDALKANDPMGGHFVLGHIDCIGVIANVRKTRDSSTIEIKTPKGAGLVVEKGSIAIDGVSLTVGKIMPDAFEAHLIPHTLNVTTLGLKKSGDEVNVELDIIGKYISRLKESYSASKITKDFLKGQGFA